MALVGQALRVQRVRRTPRDGRAAQALLDCRRP